MEFNELQREKLARELVGIEADGKHFIMNGTTADKILEAEVVNKFNDAVEEYVDKFDKKTEEFKKAADILDEKPDLEILPILNNVIVLPMENPFQKIRKTASGLIYDIGGRAMEYKNTDTGEIEEEKSGIITATVFATGADCKWLKEGDIVMYTRPSQLPIPFYKQGFYMINENRVMAVINEGLTERFNNIK